jgi:hypothetical protein
LSFVFWPLFCLSLFDLRLLITPLVWINDFNKWSSVTKYNTEMSHICMYIKLCLFKLTLIYIISSLK